MGFANKYGQIAISCVYDFAGIAIKILLKKNGEFSGTCASQSPFLNKEGEPCGLCGALPEEKCKSEAQLKKEENFSPFVD